MLRKGGTLSETRFLEPFIPKICAVLGTFDVLRSTAEWKNLVSLAYLALIGLSLVAAFLFSSPLALAQYGEHVDVITVKGVIDPFIAQYVGRGLAIAQRDGAQCLVIQLDTPGGTDTSMRVIVQKILNSPVPIVVYVSPAGARAGSAGAFITLAAHIAAMAPGTNIGAAHPVALPGTEITEIMEKKTTSDAAAYIRAIAEKRGRNAEWAEKAVRESASITAKEAVESQVVDLIADDLADLLDKIDGKEVITAAGPVTLKIRGALVRTIGMNFAENFLHVIVDPNIAYLLLSIGILALVAEFYHPGAILPAMTGAICLILAFVAFGSLPVNWGGVALIVLAVILFILDIKVAGFMLSVGGGIAFVLGSLMLFSPFAPPSPTMPRLTVSWPLIALMTTSIASFFLFALSAGIRAQRAKVASGIESMIGATGIAASDLDPWGTVQVRSELWSAVAEDGPIKKGEQVRVVSVEGVRLKVTKKAQSSKSKV
jgi:membrane-bound serine protease (ClpP class)